MAALIARSGLAVVVPPTFSSQGRARGDCQVSRKLPPSVAVASGSTYGRAASVARRPAFVRGARSTKPITERSEPRLSTHTFPAASSSHAVKVASIRASHAPRVSSLKLRNRSALRTPFLGSGSSSLGRSSPAYSVAAASRFCRRCCLASSQPNASQGPTEPQAAPSAGPLPLEVLPALGSLVGIMERMKKGEEGSEGAEPNGDDGQPRGEGGLVEEDWNLLLDDNLPSHPKLYRGQLDNGMKYVIVPNEVPPDRFEAHLELHVGSVDEEEDEQGLAHLLEHVTFLGSRKRERLLGTGTRSNAYTDFHHTVFHVHAPSTMQDTNEPMLPLVLSALHEIAFAPKFLPSRIDKERKAVLSERQMMNTIEYRVDCQLLQNLHSENRLGCRFPIGQEEQVHQWSVEQVKAFHQRWYFPANATLYVVGDIGSVAATVKQIEAHFASTPPGVHIPEATLPSPPLTPSSSSPPSSGSSSPSLLHSSAASSFSSSSLSPPSSPVTSPSLKPSALTSALSSLAPHSPGISSEEASLLPTAVTEPVRKQRHAVRPPVRHRWALDHVEGVRREEGEGEGVNGALGAVLSSSSSPSIAEEHIVGGELKDGVLMPSIFQHELLENFSLTLFCKTPVNPVRTFRDLRRAVMLRLALNALHFRIHNRLKKDNVPFLGIDVDHSDSGREGATVSTLAVTADLANWKEASQLTMQEVKRLKQFGMTHGELARYLTTMMRDSEQTAAMLDLVPSVNTLEFVMESDALGHAILDQKQSYDCMSAIAPTITLEDLNKETARMLEYIADYGSPSAPRPAAIVACVPAFLHRGNHGKDESSSTSSSSAGDEPFVVTPDEIRDTLMEGLRADVTPLAEVEVPKALIEEEKLAELLETSPPSFVPVPPSTSAAMVAASAGETPDWPLRQYDEATGVIQRRLSNGIRVNLKITANEAKGGILRLVVPGGRARDDPQEAGTVSVGVRTLSESGRVGDLSREQVELFCVSNLVSCMMDADEEFFALDMRFTTRHQGMEAALQLLHLFVQSSAWDEDALERSKQQYLSFYRSLPKSLERLTASRLLSSMFSGDTRLQDPNPSVTERLTLAEVKEATLEQLLSGHMEICIVGDFSEEEIEPLILNYLGTITSLPSPPLPPPTFTQPQPSPSVPAVLLDPRDAPLKAASTCPPHLRHQKVMIRDTDERARAYIAGPAPNRWGVAPDGRDINTIMEPIPPAYNESEREGGGAGPSFLSRAVKKFQAVVGGDPSSQLLPQQQDQARALAPLGVTVVEGPGGQKYWHRRRHPLFTAVCLELLTEVVNSRLFTTVRDTLGLTYEVNFEISMFDRLPIGWFVISATSSPDKIEATTDASLNVLRGLSANRVSQRELDRAKRTLITRYESDLKDNNYWLGLITHLQSDYVPRKTISAVADLKMIYEVTTVDDLYTVYNHIPLDDSSIFTAIGVAGSAYGGEGPARDEELDVAAGDDEGSSQPMVGRGRSMVTRPTA